MSTQSLRVHPPVTQCASRGPWQTLAQSPTWKVSSRLEAHFLFESHEFSKPQATFPKPHTD